jgi:hypothetical protein
VRPTWRCDHQHQQANGTEAEAIHKQLPSGQGVTAGGA